MTLGEDLSQGQVSGERGNWVFVIRWSLGAAAGAWASGMGVLRKPGSPDCRSGIAVQRFMAAYAIASDPAAPTSMQGLQLIPPAHASQHNSNPQHPHDFHSPGCQQLNYHSSAKPL